MLSLKKGIQVKIISGKDKGKTGEILEINRSLGKVRIEPNLVMLGMIILQKNKSQLSNI